MLPPTGIEPTPFRNSTSKVAGLQVHATTPGQYTLLWEVSRKEDKIPISLQYLKNQLTKIVHWSHYEKMTESSKSWENKNGQIYRNQETGAQFFKISVMPWIP